MPIDKQKFIQIQNDENQPEKPPKITLTIQSNTIKEVGVNGIQAQDIITYSKLIIESLNEQFPCNENIETIAQLDRAIYWQNKRTIDRIKRNVEGENKI